MNLKMVKSGLVLACVALAQWVSAQQAPQMEALPIDPNVRYADWPTSSNTWHSTGQNIFPVKTC